MQFTSCLCYIITHSMLVALDSGEKIFYVRTSIILVVLGRFHTVPVTGLSTFGYLDIVLSSQ